jgi:hypothetical protein
MRRVLAVIGGLFLYGTILEAAQAELADWRTPTWASGSLSKSFDVSQGSAGNYLTLMVSRDKSSFAAGNGQTRAVTAASDGRFGGNTGTESGKGNATIAFDATDLGPITLTDGNGMSFANPSDRHSGLEKTSFSVVPEVRTAWPCFVACAIIACTVRRRQRPRKLTRFD